MSENILKPCPFCGSKSVWVADNILDYMFIGYNVHCNGCGVETSYTKDKDKAIEKWNRRVLKMANRFDAICGQEKDRKFLVEIIEQICDYAVVNDMKSTDTVTTIANNLLTIAKIANLDNWNGRTENE